MKRIYLSVFAMYVCACSALHPYKDQSFEYLQNISQHPADYYGKMISFGGEIKGITESTQNIRLVLKTEAPFYYAATGKAGAALSYELILVDYEKTLPEMSGLKKGNELKVLARVSNYEKRTNMLGNPIGVLHVAAVALADRTQKKDFFYHTSPEKQLYESWKKGRLFYEETPEQIEEAYPSQKPAPSQTAAPSVQTAKSPTLNEIVYDEEEEFVIQ